MPVNISRRSPVGRVDRLYNRCLTILEREITQLEHLSIAVKLESTPARDLRDYIKILGEMKAAQTAISEKRKALKEANAKKLTEAELAAQVLPK
jgi:hypothetical protein